MRRGILACVLVLTVGAAAATGGRAWAADPLPLNGDFEAGSTGWAPADGGTLTVGAADPVNGGAAAGHVVSSSAAPVTIRTQYWLSPAVPGNEYALSLAVRIPAATMTSVTARIDIVTLPGAVLVSNQVDTPGPTAGYVTLTAAPVTALPGADYVQVVITGTPTGAGARFSVDDIVVTETVPPPPPAPPIEPVLPDPDPGPALPVATPIRVTIPRPTATSRPEPRGTALVNTQFDTGLAGWNVVQGRAWTDTWIPGQGSSMVLHTDSASMVWAEQAVNGITPGAWYGASALLSTNGDVELGWLRLVWYDSPDGRGRELTYADSLVVGAAEEADVAAAPLYQVVGTHAVQAPSLAQSAAVRFMLRSSARAALIIDNVAFGETADPSGAPRPAPLGAVTTPTGPVAATPTATPAAPAASVVAGAFAGLGSPPGTPAAAPVAAASSPAPPSAPPPARAAAALTPRAALTVEGGLRVEDVVSPGIADAQRALRITQVLPDPEHPGRDAEYEWVEITNLGSAAASVEGMTVRDNSGSVTLPALVIPAGGSLVVTARLAEVTGATAFRVPGGIGNGLGNAGDRLVLTGADGRQVDAFSYGEDITFLAGARIPAPGTGRAIAREFGPDGRFRAARVVDDPAPGRGAVEGPPAGLDVPAEAAASSAGAGTGAAEAWVVLLALGGGILGGAVMQHLSGVVRDRR